MNFYPHFPLSLSDFSEIRTRGSAHTAVKLVIFVEIIAWKAILFMGVSEITFT